jgi:hypothetical protein
LIAVSGLVGLCIVGCGSVRHTAKFETAFVPKPDTQIEVGAVTNETGKTFEIDIPKMLTDAFGEALANERLLWTGSTTSEHLIITSKIVEYEEGDAFKRWLLPGWGTTVLSIHCELKESTTGRMIGAVDARRTVSIGGAYSIGAWRTVFAGVAKDVVKELRAKISA